MKVSLQHEESIEIRHGVVRFLFPNLPANLLSKSSSFYCDGKKVSRPVERLRVVLRKKYIAAGHLKGINQDKIKKRLF